MLPKMCGRFALTLPYEAMAQLFDAVLSNDLMPIPRYNICPTHNIPVVVSQEASRRIVSMRWGFLPKWYKTPTDGPLLINARAETVAEKPAFRNAARSQRCLIPATGFYEWTKDTDGARLPWYIHRQEPTAFAGIWQRWSAGEDELTTCAIITTAAKDPLTAVHHRMPVAIEPENHALWLGEAGPGAAPLMTAASAAGFDFFRVSTAVNSNRSEGPELIDQLIE